MAEPIDPTAKADFATLAKQYEAMQRQAYTSQDVDVPTVQNLGSSLDTYITAHVADEGARAELLASKNQVLESMAHTADQQQNHSTLNNAGWDADREALEALFAEIMPEGAESVYSPVAAAKGGTADAATDGETAAEEGSDAAAEAADTDTKTAPEAIAGDQSGTGWGGADLLDPKTTATYKGPSLDGLLAMPDSLVAREIGNQPDVVAAIRKVSAETGVPSGLMAAMIIQESNGDRTTVSGTNPGYASKPQDQQVDAGLIQSPLWAFEGDTTAEKRKNSEDPYTNLKVFAEEAVGTYDRTGSWGQVAQVWYTGEVADRLGGVSAGGSDETNYVLNVFGNLGMGASTYYGKEDT